MHIETDTDAETVKRAAREELSEHGICHATPELERGAKQPGMMKLLHEGHQRKTRPLQIFFLQ